MRLRQAASLWIAALISASGALADVQGERIPPSFTAEEAQIIARDPRLVGVAGRCARQLRQALDALVNMSQGTRVGIVVEPCPAASDGKGRASDEGALDILKILKDASEQGSSRAGGGDAAAGPSGPRPPAFTSDEMALVFKDRTGKLLFAAQHCAWQLRHALDSLHYGGASDWPPQRRCVEGSTRSSAEGALDILKILREASEDNNN